MLKIIDYGLGNVSAFLNIYKRLGVRIEPASTASQLEGATRIILPGVGAFDEAIKALNSSGMRPLLEDLVLHRKTPFLGICVGMQILAEQSEEGVQPGLGFIKGTVKRFCNEKRDLKQLPIPHMGWNTLHPKRKHELFSGLSDEPRLYFLHSYYFECENPENSLAETEYQQKYTSVVNRENVIGVQCHPEKSHSAGSTILANFSSIST